MRAKPWPPEVRNADVVRALRELSLLLDIDGVQFKPCAYEKAAYAVEGLSRPIADIHSEGGVAGLDEIPNVGSGIAHRIAELLTSGRISDLDALRAKYPVDALGLASVEGMGPKSIRLVWERLGVRDVADLRRAAEQGKLHDLEHFGEKREHKLLAAIGIRESLRGRFPLPVAADDVLAELDWVGAAIHTHFDQPRAEMTRRIVRALEHPLVNALFHPTCRTLGRRPAVDADFDAVIAAARRTGTALEIDAQPERLGKRRGQAPRSRGTSRSVARRSRAT